MKFLFRCDASLNIGSGHVMRCMTLAKELRKSGHECLFVCRVLVGDLIELIEQNEFPVVRLIDSDNKIDTKLSHSAWLECSLKLDALQSKEVIDSYNPNWIVVDHYALDIEWENSAKNNSTKLLVIDDLADREHNCNILLDQNLGRQIDDYIHLVNTDCYFLIGPQYTLLRDEFLEHRIISLNRRADSHQVNTILINMGGVDKDNITGKILRELYKLDIAANIKYRVVLGLKNPWIAEIKSLAIDAPYDTEVLVNVQNMAELLTYSDLAIGAAGSSTWERCCLGVPSIIMVIADNQKAVAQLLDEMNIAIKASNTKEINQIIYQLLNVKASTIKQLSDNSKLLIDGLGIKRIMKVINV